MGQRHQYIVIYGANGDEIPERAEVIHHQWLYGRSAIASLERALILATNSYDPTFDSLFGRSSHGHWCGDGTNAIAAAISVDPAEGYFHPVHVLENKEINGAVELPSGAFYMPPVKLDPNDFDNNDGITLIKFKRGEVRPGYCFITPGHLSGYHWPKAGLPKFGPWTAAEYLEFYYTPTEQDTEWAPDLRQFMSESLARIDSMARLMTAEEVSNLLPKFPFDKPKSKKKAS